MDKLVGSYESCASNNISGDCSAHNNQIWTIGFNIMVFSYIGNLPKSGKLPIWENMARKKEMKKDYPYKLNKAMASPLA